MFLFLPVCVREPSGETRIPLANALLLAANVSVFFLGEYLGFFPAVGRGTGLLTILTYGFVHAGPGHLLANLWVLWLFGNPVNRRLGDAYYLLAYLGTLLAVGLVARLLAPGPLVGASGAIFAILVLFGMLLPRAQVENGYVALLPVTLLIGLFRRPPHWLGWFVRWGSFAVSAWLVLLVVPLLELFGLWANGWNWTNLAHLLGLGCGLAVVLLLPTRITMKRRPSPVLVEFADL